VTSGGGDIVRGFNRLKISYGSVKNLYLQDYIFPKFEHVLQSISYKNFNHPVNDSR
jgi:hypothetical protein